MEASSICLSKGGHITKIPYNVLSLVLTGFHVYLTQARVTWEERILIEKMPP